MDADVAPSRPTSRKGAIRLAGPDCSWFARGMTNDEEGLTALTIPALASNAELVEMAVRPAARDHIRAWDAGQRLVSIHESGHAVAAAAAPTMVPVRAIDITLRHAGVTTLGGAFE